MGDNNDLAELKAEQRHMNTTMMDIADNVKKLTDFMVEQSAQARANEEKFLRIHQRIDDGEKCQREQEHSLTVLTTEVIPSIERDAAVKGALWKMVGAVSIPVGTAIGSIVWAVTRFNNDSAKELSLLKEAIQALIKTNGG